jgi:hypothetical protein
MKDGGSFMKNYKLIPAGILSMALVFGLAFIGCENEPPNEPGELPAVSGENALSGKTYFNDSNQEKIVFAATATGAANGTYTRFAEKRDDNYNPVLTNDSKYTYVDIETGTYAWNATKKQVTLKPEKVALRGDHGSYGSLVDKAAHQKSIQAMIDQMIKNDGEAAVNAQLKAMGFSSVSAYIIYAADQEFANKTNGYEFSTDTTALFLDEPLPKNTGENELSGKTYNGLSWNNNNTATDPTKIYIFTTKEDYTFTDSNYPSNNQTGTYAYEISGAGDNVRKRIYLKPSKVNDKTRDAYYTSLAENPYVGYYASADDYRAARTNGAFSINEEEYNSTKKIIGWED